MQSTQSRTKECANPACQNTVKSRRSVFCSHECYCDYEKEYFRRIRGEKSDRPNV